MERTAQYRVPVPRVEAVTDVLVLPEPGSKIWQPLESVELVHTAKP
jgi:hypothetical protein